MDIPLFVVEILGMFIAFSWPSNAGGMTVQGSQGPVVVGPLHAMPIHDETVDAFTAGTYRVALSPPDKWAGNACMWRCDGGRLG